MNEVEQSTADELALSLPADPASVAVARHALVDFAEPHAVDLGAVAMAVSEAVGNAVAHGFRSREQPGTVWVTARRTRDALVVVVEDDGDGIRPRVDSPGLGLGLSIIKAVSETLVIEDLAATGTRLTISFAPSAD